MYLGRLQGVFCVCVCGSLVSFSSGCLLTPHPQTRCGAEIATKVRGSSFAVHAVPRFVAGLWATPCRSLNAHSGRARSVGLRPQPRLKAKPWPGAAQLLQCREARPGRALRSRDFSAPYSHACRESALGRLTTPGFYPEARAPGLTVTTPPGRESGVGICGRVLSLAISDCSARRSPTSPPSLGPCPPPSLLPSRPRAPDTLSLFSRGAFPSASRRIPRSFRDGEWRLVLNVPLRELMAVEARRKPGPEGPPSGRR